MLKFSKEELHRVLFYDPKVGDFLWKEKPCSMARIKIGEKAGEIDKDGYRIITVFSQRIKAHRLAFYYMEGYIPEGLVDHKNQIPDDNRWKNLRKITTQGNARNQKLAKNNTSGIMGVSFYSNRWYAYIRVDKLIRLGSFIKKDDAVKVRWEAEIKYNFVEVNTYSSAYKYLKENSLL